MRGPLRLHGFAPVFSFSFPEQKKHQLIFNFPPAPLTSSRWCEERGNFDFSSITLYVWCQEMERGTERNRKTRKRMRDGVSHMENTKITSIYRYLWNNSLIFAPICSAWNWRQTFLFHFHSQILYQSPLDFEWLISYISGIVHFFIQCSAIYF